MRFPIQVIAVSFMLISLATGKPVATSAEAVDVFRAVWKQSLVNKGQTRPFLRQLKQQVFEDGKVSGRSDSSENVRQRVNSSLTAGKREELIISGALNDLLPDRKVWVVTHPGDRSSGFQAVLDAADGKLLLFWITPEG